MYIATIKERDNLDRKIDISVHSEIGKLNVVIIHPPGPEVESMIPDNVERALYSDILNLSVASNEYLQFEQVLNKVSNVLKVKDLFLDILQLSKVKKDIIKKISACESVPESEIVLNNLSNEEIARQLIEGVILIKDNLTKFLDKNRYSLRPLHNFFFTRDSAVAIGNDMLISKMANQVRMREATIMQTIFQNLQLFKKNDIFSLNLDLINNSEVKIEGGDVIVLRKDILLIGLGQRTSSQGIDHLINKLKKKDGKFSIIIQELPESPESFIHLDMVFTMLDYDKCMIYKPLIIDSHRYSTYHLEIDNHKVTKIREEDNILHILKSLGMDLKPLICGGNNDIYVQQREQWHSGANFLAFAPGKVIGYARNSYTIEELNKNGFEVIKADDIINNKMDLNNYNKCVVTIKGAELARGGGGARCMTMPIQRENI